MIKHRFIFANIYIYISQYDNDCLTWYPNGFTKTPDKSSKYTDYEQTSVNGSYDLDDMVAYLQELGLTETADSYGAYSEMTYCITSKSGNECIDACVVGEPNLGNTCPLFLYSFTFDSRSGKLSDVNMTIYGHIAS